MPHKTQDMPLQSREAVFVPATINEAERTVELVWTTGAQVRRYDWWEGRAYFEELVVDADAVDLSRLNGGAPLLNSHGAYDLSDVLGVVERAWIDGKDGRAVVRFPAAEDDPDADKIYRKVKGGIIRNVSVGYQVREYQIEEKQDQPPIYRAVDWMPMEISLVAIPADAGAGVRSEKPTDRTSPCVFTRASAAQSTKEDNMSQASPAAPTAQDLDAVRAEAITAERARVSEINLLCDKHGLSAEFRKGLIDNNASVDAARAAVLEELATRDAGGTRRRSPHIETITDEVETRREAVENAILHRAAPGKVKLTDAGRQYRGMSLIEMGRDLLEKSGVNTRGMDKLQLAQRALGTSDFPIILANVANKTLRAGYEAAPQTFKPFTKQSSAPDFKAIQRSQMGDAPTLKKVNEHGEFTVGTIGEGKETYQLATYGRIVSITRQTIINDDLQAFADLPAKFGRAAADLESDIVWGIVTGNAAMNDGVALFHADHGNLAGAGAIAVATLSAMRAAMRVQKSLDGRPINVTPAFLLVPAALETVANQYTSADFVSAKSSDINPFKNTLQVIAEPRLDAASTSIWYGAADPAQIDTIEYCYLEGSEGVYIETRNGFEVDGLEIKARLDFAAKAIDHRGLYRNG